MLFGCGLSRVIVTFRICARSLMYPLIPLDHCDTCMSHMSCICTIHPWSPLHTHDAITVKVCQVLVALSVRIVFFCVSPSWGLLLLSSAFLPHIISFSSATCCPSPGACVHPLISGSLYSVYGYCSPVQGLSSSLSVSPLHVSFVATSAVVLFK